ANCPVVAPAVPVTEPPDEWRKSDEDDLYPPGGQDRLDRWTANLEGSHRSAAAPGSAGAGSIRNTASCLIAVWMKFSFFPNLLTRECFEGKGSFSSHLPFLSRLFTWTPNIISCFRFMAKNGSASGTAETDRSYQKSLSRNIFPTPTDRSSSKRN